MFGYVLPVKCEMRVRDFETYRAAYCGLCKQLGEDYGLASRMLLNYDLVLLALIADAMSGDAGEMRREGCLVNPVSKKPTLYGTAGLRLGSDGLLLLSYHKFRDNAEDDRGAKRLLAAGGAGLLRRRYRRAAQRRPACAAAVEAQMERQRQLEAAGSASPDEAASPTAEMCRALFCEAAPDEQSREALGRMGLFCGQVIYLLDAAEDYEEDEKQGTYNVFLRAGLSKAEAVEAAQRRCRMAAGEIARSYTALAPRQYKEILDNIVYLGLPAAIASAGRKAKGMGHGQIQGS